MCNTYAIAIFRAAGALHNGHWTKDFQYIVCVEMKGIRSKLNIENGCTNEERGILVYTYYNIYMAECFDDNSMNR